MVASVQLLRKPTFHAHQSLEEKVYYQYSQSSLTNGTLQPAEIVVVYHSIDFLHSKYPETLKLVVRQIAWLRQA